MATKPKTSTKPPGEKPPSAKKAARLTTGHCRKLALRNVRKALGYLEGDTEMADAIGALEQANTVLSPMAASVTQEEAANMSLEEVLQAIADGRYTGSVKQLAARAIAGSKDGFNLGGKEE